MKKDYTTSNNKIVLSLKTIKAICNDLGNPQDTFKAIHITGTNGKGSVGAYIESILIDNGLTVGRYVSPAIVDVYETITINRKKISEQDYLICKQRVLSVSENLHKQGYAMPSPFELDTAIAYTYLANRCDVAIIEVGMGGRLDATNVLSNKILSVITSISMDHTEYLGDTIQQIALEKCGIVCNDVPTVTIEQSSQAMEVIKTVCEQKHSKLIVANPKDISNVKLLKDYTLNFNYGEYVDLNSKMIGDYQTDNAIISIKACETLNVPKDTIVKGIADAVWKYRFEIVSTNPIIVLDGCHNADASVRLRRSIETYFKGKKLSYIMGVYKDKDYPTMAKSLCGMADTVYTIPTLGSRSLSATTLADTVKQYNHNVIACNDINTALNLSKHDGSEVIIVFGSLSTLSKVQY